MSDEAKVENIYEHEGVPVNEFQAKLPSVTVDCDYYKHNTVLRLAVEVRVRGEAYKEDKEGNMIRVHDLAIQDIEVVSSFDPSQAVDGVQGSLAGGAPSPDDEGIGLDVGSTSDQWPAGVARTDDGKLVDTETGEVVQPSEPEDEPSPLDEQIEREVEEAKPEPDPEPKREPVAADVGF